MPKGRSAAQEMLSMMEEPLLIEREKNKKKKGAEEAGASDSGSDIASGSDGDESVYTQADGDAFDDDDEDDEIPIQHIKHAFDSYTEGSRYLNNERVGEALRSLGLMTPHEELEAIVSEVILASLRQQGARGTSGPGGGLGAASAAVGKEAGTGALASVDSLAYAVNFGADATVANFGSDAEGLSLSRFHRSVDVEKFAAIAQRVHAKERAAVRAAIGGTGGEVFKPSDAALLDYQAAFRTFDREGVGYVDISRIGMILHQIGLHTSEAELRVIKMEMDRDGTGTLRFDHFLVMVARLRQDECAMDELLEAFSVFDPDGTGLVDLEEMKEAMREMCDVMTEDEIEDMFARSGDAVDAEGKVDYRRLIHSMVKSMGMSDADTTEL